MRGRFTTEGLWCSVPAVTLSNNLLRKSILGACDAMTEADTTGLPFVSPQDAAARPWVAAS